MMLWFFSNTGKAIAWSALDSLWQWGILWLSYSLLVRAKGFEKPAIRYNLALLHYFTGVVLFILYFFAHCTGIPSFSLRDISFPDVEQIGHSDQFLPALNFFLGVVYLLTGAIRFSRIMVGLHHIRKMKSDGEPIQNTWISNLANEWQHKIGVPTPIHLWMSNKINGPLTTGFLKPVIFFPFCVVTNLSSIELETLLLHELMHVKRHDYFLNITVQLAQCLLFFNPFSDQLVKEIETERELEVDDLVIGSIHNPFSYATALHSVQQAYGHSRLTMNAATGEQQLLLMRIKRILKQPSEKASFNPKPFFLPVLAGILLWVIISIPPQRITVAKNNATNKVEQVIKLTAQGKGSSSANPVKTRKTSQRLLAVTAIQKRSETKSVRQSPANIAEAMAEEKFIRVKANGPVIASTFSVNKEDRSFTYESNAKDNSASPLLSPEEPFIPSNSFEKGKEAYSETAGNKNANAAAYRERMEQVRLLSVLLERIQHASSREEKIQLMQQWSKEMKKRKNSPPVKIKKIVVL